FVARLALLLLAEPVTEQDAIEPADAVHRMARRGTVFRLRSRPIEGSFPLIGRVLHELLEKAYGNLSVANKKRTRERDLPWLGGFQVGIRHGESSLGNLQHGYLEFIDEPVPPWKRCS